MAVRGGSEPVGEVWFTGEITEDTPCSEGVKSVNITATSDADVDGILANPTNYAVKFNDIELPTFEDQSDEDHMLYSWSISESVISPALIYSNGESWIAFAPCDFTGDVNIYVAHK